MVPVAQNQEQMFLFRLTLHRIIVYRVNLLEEGGSGKVVTIPKKPTYICSNDTN